MQAVRDGGGITEVVVVVQHRIGEGLRHMADILGLRHQVEGPVLDILEHVGHAVRTVEVHIALLLADECFVAHGLEALPVGHEILYHADVGAGLDVEIASIKETAHIEPRDQLEPLVTGIDGPLAVEIEVVGMGRRLQIALLEGFAVPDAIAFVDRHMIHVDRNPDIAGGIGNAVIHVLADDEIVGADVPVAQEINARFLHGREVEFGVVILEIIAPGLDRAGENALSPPILAYTENLGFGEGLVELVQFDHGNLGLRRQVANLREAHVGLTHPAVHGVGFNGPAEYLAGLAGRQQAA